MPGAMRDRDGSEIGPKPALEKACVKFVFPCGWESRAEVRPNHFPHCIGGRQCDLETALGSLAPRDVEKYSAGFGRCVCGEGHERILRRRALPVQGALDSFRTVSDREPVYS